MRLRAVLVAVALVFAFVPVVTPDPPATSGPYVVRGEFDGAAYDWWWGAADYKRGYFAAYGVDLLSWCEGNPTGYSIWSFQDVNVPADEGLVHTLQKADDVFTSVWPVSVLDFTSWPDGFCNNLFDVGEPLAVGTVDAVMTDNDYWAWMYDHNRANAYGISVHGVVTASDGERMGISSGFRCVWLTGSNGDDPGAHCKEKVVLH